MGVARRQGTLQLPKREMGRWKEDGDLGTAPPRQERVGERVQMKAVRLGTLRTGDIGEMVCQEGAM